MINESAYINKTVLTVPARLEGDFGQLVTGRIMFDDSDWVKFTSTSENKLIDFPIIKYVRTIINDPKRFCLYTYSKISNYGIEKRKTSNSGEHYVIVEEREKKYINDDGTFSITLSKMDLLCFSSGIAFVELTFLYNRYDFELIREFTSNIRNVANKYNPIEPGKPCWKLDEFISHIFSSTCISPLYDSSGDNQAEFGDAWITCFHLLCDKNLQAESEESEEQLIKDSINLARSSKLVDEIYDNNQYDQTYHPSSDRFFALTNEGFAFLKYIRKDSKNSYLSLFNNAYAWMFRLALHQRLLSIKLLEMCALESYDNGLSENLISAIADLKTVYSYRVISDSKDFNYLWEKFGKVFKVDELMSDIDECYSKFNQIIESKRERREKVQNLFLTFISLLAIFSALIDLTSYVDRWFDGIRWIAVFSIIVIVVIFALFLCIWLLSIKKR